MRIRSFFKGSSPNSPAQARVSREEWTSFPSLCYRKAEVIITVWGHNLSEHWSHRRLPRLHLVLNKWSVSHKYNQIFALRTYKGLQPQNETPPHLYTVTISHPVRHTVAQSAHYDTQSHIKILASSAASTQKPKALWTRPVPPQRVPDPSPSAFPWSRPGPCGAKDLATTSRET